MTNLLEMVNCLTFRDISSFVPIVDICQQLRVAGIYFDRGQVVLFPLHV